MFHKFVNQIYNRKMIRFENGLLIKMILSKIDRNTKTKA